MFCQISPTQNICVGDSVSLGGTATSGVNYTWTSHPPGFTSNQSNPLDSPMVTTTYYLEATNGLCPNPAFDSVMVVVSNMPTISIGNDTIICQGQSVLLGNTVIESNVTYQWTPALGLDDPSFANPLASPNQNTVYYLVANRMGCLAQASIAVNVFEQPTLEVNADTIAPRSVVDETDTKIEQNGKSLFEANGSQTANVKTCNRYGRIGNVTWASQTVSPR